MAIMGNKWVEKEFSKHSLLKATAPAYEAASHNSFDVPDPKKRIKRHTKASRSNLVKTLRGIRKV